MHELLPSSDAVQPDEAFAVRTRFDDPVHVVEVWGELDIAYRDRVIRECTAMGLRHVLVDLSNLTFMDCAGYSAFVVARAILAVRGGSLALSQAAGEPLRLLGLIADLERGGVVAARRS